MLRCSATIVVCANQDHKVKCFFDSYTKWILIKKVCINEPKNLVESEDVAAVSVASLYLKLITLEPMLGLSQTHTHPFSLKVKLV